MQTFTNLLIRPTYPFYRLCWGLLLASLFLIQCSNVDHPPLPPTPPDVTLSVALLLPTEGELATVGRSVQNGLVLAFDEWNEQGGLLDQPITWQTYATACTFDSGQQAAQQAIAAGHQFLIGPVCSEAALGAAAIAHEAEALLISPTATHPLVTIDPQQQTRLTVFTISYGYTLQGQAAAQFAFDTLALRHAAVLYSPNNSYTAILAEAFVERFNTTGGEIVAQVTYSQATSDFNELLLNIEATNADLLYLPADPATANRIMTQLKEQGSTIQILGSDAWEGDQLDLSLVEGSYFPVHYTNLSPRPEVQIWAEKYRSVYAIEPNTLAVLGYDAANIFAQAVQQSASDEAVTVAQTMAKQQFDGVIGPLTFADSHQPIKPIPFIQIREQSWHYITSVK